MLYMYVAKCLQRFEYGHEVFRVPRNVSKLQANKTLWTSVRPCSLRLRVNETVHVCFATMPLDTASKKVIKKDIAIIISASRYQKGTCALYVNRMPTSRQTFTFNPHDDDGLSFFKTTTYRVKYEAKW